MAPSQALSTIPGKPSVFFTVSSGQRCISEQAYEAPQILAHVYMRTGQYRRLIATMEERWVAFPNKPSAQQERIAMVPCRDLPDQMAGKPQLSTLRHNGDIFLPISINGKPASYFFDTGAAISCMSESEAKRLV